MLRDSLEKLGRSLWRFERNWPHMLIGSCLTSKCGFAGVGVALLEEMCRCGGRLSGSLC